MQEFGVISGNIQFSPRKKHILVNTYSSWVPRSLSPMRTIDWKWLKANWGQSQTKWRLLCPILFPRPFHAYHVIPISFETSVFLLLKNLCDSAISWWIGGCLIIHQVLKREIPWVPGYVRVVVLLFIQPNKQGTREPSHCFNYIWFISLFNSKS